MRECGKCSLCCKLLGITELKKPPGVWCENARVPGGGCKVYDSRPNSCRTFECGWLINETFGDHWNPLRSKMIISFNADSEPHKLQIWMDKSNPRAWEVEPYKSEISKLAADGKGKYQTELRFPTGHIVIVK